MSDKTRTKYQDVPFIVDGITKIVKSVTSQTTCADVINKLPKDTAPLVVYASVDGNENELSKKTKILKVWRSYSSLQNVVFVVRRSETDCNTSKRFEQQTVVSNKDGTKYRLKQFSSFIKEKKQQLNRRFSEGPSTLHSSLKPKKTSNNMTLESTRLSTVLDRSTAPTNQHKMATKQTTAILNVKPTLDTRAIIEALTTKKLCLKIRSQPVTKTTSESTSTGSLRSSDTGYSSASPDAPQTLDQHTKKQTKLLADTEDGPRHSTPVAPVHSRKRRNAEIETTLEGEIDEFQGKSLLLRKFMEDQSFYGTPTNDICPVVPEMPANKRRRTDNRLSLPAFATKKEKCRVPWGQYNDSEPEGSDTSFMNDSTMDIAFLDSFNFESDYMAVILTNQKKNMLRRESAMSNLTKFSLHQKEATIAEEANDSYDYSFECSFQRMDESKVAEFGADFHQQFDNHIANESDYSVDSFMKTRLELDDCDNFVSKKAVDSFSMCDEGIGSSSSGSVS